METILLAIIVLFVLSLILLCVSCVLALPMTLRQMGYSEKELTIWGR